MATTGKSNARSASMVKSIGGGSIRKAVCAPCARRKDALSRLADRRQRLGERVPASRCIAIVLANRPHRHLFGDALERRDHRFRLVGLDQFDNLKPERVLFVRVQHVTARSYVAQRGSYCRARSLSS